MTKALLKKQLSEVFSWIYHDRNTGKRRSSSNMIGFIILYLIVFGTIISMFYKLSKLMCEPLLSAGYGWLYIALIGVASATMGIFGSVFSTYTTLYQAKDNDLLLSMPIPVRTILIGRLSGVFAMGLMYELLVMIPAIAVYLMHADLNTIGTAGVVFTLLIPIVLSVFVLAISCILGWLVACVNSRLKNQKILTVILCLGFIAAYYYVFGNLNRLLEKILANPADLGNKIRGVLYPIYHMGKAAEGNAVSMLLFTLIVLAFFAVVYFVMQHSFMKLATSNRGSHKVKYVEKTAQLRSPERALLGKEFRRFLGSVNYMLNCSLGSLFSLIAAVMVIVKSSTISEVASQINNSGFVALLIVAAICTVATMNDITAPSVSLEGKSIWLTQMMPVSGWQILKAKLHMHLILTLIPMAILTLCVEIVLKPSPVFALLIPLTVGLFIVLMSMIGLFCNLKLPNLNWSSEITPIKQSASVTITLFGGWVVIIVLAVIWYWLRNIVSPLIYMLITDGAIVILNLMLYNWLKTKGSTVFENL